MRVFIGCAFLVATLFTASTAVGDIFAFTATIDESQEVPPTGSSATGSATITLNDVTNLLEWNIEWSGLTGPATGMHFHNAPAGSNGGIVIDIGAISGLTSPSIGSTTIDDSLETEFKQDRIYINIHTSEFPGGEIRGQVLNQGVVPEPASGVVIAAVLGTVALRRRR